MRKNIVYTTLLFIFSILLIGGSVIVSQARKVETKKIEEEINIEDELITKLMERVNKTTLLREPNYNYQNVKEEIKIPYLYHYLNKEDYSLIKINPKKIVCEVTDKISFVSSTPCFVKVIANQVFLDYQEDYFHTKEALEFKAFETDGSTCKNDGSHYYCLLEEQTQTIKTFSLIESAKKTEETITIYEYYIKINTDSINSCLNFYPNSYCQDIQDYNLIELEDDIIKEKGVLFKHTFKKIEEDKYFLESSLVA